MKYPSILQETKRPPRKRPNNVILEGYHGYFEDAETPGYAGIATLTKAIPLNVIHGIGDHECDKEGRTLTLEFKDYFIFNTYVPNAGEYLVTLDKKLNWNRKFKEFLLALDRRKPVICCGDFNVAHAETDLASPKASSEKAGI